MAAIAVIPSAPVLVPELAGAAAAELADMRTAVLAAASALPSRWIVVGTGRDTGLIGPGDAGTFAGYGVDLPVRLSPDATGPVTELPLCALIAGWVRGQVAAQACAEVRVYRDDLDTPAALTAGRELRVTIDQAGDDIGVLVVADGVHTLTPWAPGGYDPDSPAAQQALDDALAAGDTAALARLDAGVLGRAAYQVLAGLGTPSHAEELYRGAPYGVGYFVGVWTPAGGCAPAGWSAATGGCAPAGWSAATGGCEP
nr:hypothetical protein [Mycolicibacterium fluoranthenivorans]